MNAQKAKMKGNEASKNQNERKCKEMKAQKPKMKGYTQKGQNEKK